MLLFAGAICAMNAIWLGFSSSKVVVGHRGVASVIIRVDEELIDLGNLRTGESRFLFLPRSSSPSGSTFSISFLIDGQQMPVCTLGVERTGQHVDVVLNHDAKSTCELSSPILSELFVTKVF